MFIGHYAAGFAGKKFAPKVSLGTLILGAILADLLWPIFLLLDVEHFRVAPGITLLSPFDFYDYPLSHSLFMSLAWAALVGLAYLAVTKDGRGSWVMGGLVLSHWVLDFIVHRPDLPIWPEQFSITYPWKVGLGLWNSMAGTLLVEGGITLLGLWLYVSSTKALDEVGKWSFWGLVLFLVAAYALDLNSGKPSNEALTHFNPNLVSLMGFSQLLLVGWAYWIEDHRGTVG